jgi:hypothetical protein
MALRHSLPKSTVVKKNLKRLFISGVPAIAGTQ